MTDIHIWLLFMLVMAIAELFTTGLTTIWFAIGAGISCLLAYLDVSIYIQIPVFIISSILLLLLIRPVFGKLFNKKVEASGPQTLIGKTAIVTREVDLFGNGRVKVEGMEWKAKSKETIFEDEECKICDITGVTLIVNPVDE